MIDVASGTALGNMTPKTTRQLIEKMTSNSQQFGTRTGTIVVRSVHDVDQRNTQRSWRQKMMLLPHWSTNLLQIRNLFLQKFVAFVHLLII